MSRIIVDLFRRSLWHTIQPHLSRATCCFNWHRNWSYTLRLYITINYASILESEAYLSKVLLLLGQRNSTHCNEFTKGKYIHFSNPRFINPGITFI